MKNFKLSLLASAALLALTGVTQAADVEVYGLIDQGLKVTRDGGETTFEMNPGQIAGSRVGLRIKEDISPDLKVYVNLENGFDADTGAMGDGPSGRLGCRRHRRHLRRQGLALRHHVAGSPEQPDPLGRRRHPSRQRHPL